MAGDNVSTTHPIESRIRSLIEYYSDDPRDLGDEVRKAAIRLSGYMLDDDGGATDVRDSLLTLFQLADAIDGGRTTT